ncbi:MAG: sulfatase-like hydrolase/transferase, partial [Planctomycetes bacterium]|nr:sulfatase-like hydrolase/transferase [Planctomycetota bacterium]
MPFLRSLLALLLTTLAVAQAPRPNIVLIVVDDLGWRDLGCQGSDYFLTPQIDALAASGTRFTNAYANAPNCAPSRACLMSGQYAPRHGVYTVGSSARGRSEDRLLQPTPNTEDLRDDVVTLAEALRGCGYATAHFGKWHLGPDPTTQGFERNVAGNRAGSPPGGHFSPYRNPQLADGPEGEYLTDRLTDEAIL